jgi:hypothetical protein
MTNGSDIYRRDREFLFNALSAGAKERLNDPIGSGQSD